MLLTAGCGSDSKRRPRDPQWRRTGIIDPAVVTGQLKERICYALFEGLLRFDRFGEPKLGAETGICQAMRNLHVHLRKRQMGNGVLLQPAALPNPGSGHCLPRPLWYAYLLYH